jgi:hypothetical protein
MKWHVDPDPRVDGADQVCDENGHTVCFIATGRDDQEKVGNLMAAAPDLYAILKAILATGDLDDGLVIVEWAREAIAKAEGRS